MREANWLKTLHPFFSYIVPIFNAKGTLNKCLSSILEQTFLNYEAILIDDGSTDGSAQIAKHFCEHNPRFQYYRQENAGSSSAYNKGINLARGQFLVFLDNDDWNSPKTLESTYWALCEDPTIDIVQFSLIEEHENNLIAKTKQYAVRHFFSGPKEICYAAEKGFISSLTHSGKAIRRELFFTEEPILFNGFAKGADLFLIRRLLCLARKVAVVPEAEWHFLIRASSQSHRAISGHTLAQYHYYGVETALNEIAFYQKHYSSDFLHPIWQLDNLAWDSFLAYCRALKRDGLFDKRKVSCIALQIWKKRTFLLSNKKRRAAVLMMSIIPKAVMALLILHTRRAK